MARTLAIVTAPTELPCATLSAPGSPESDDRSPPRTSAGTFPPRHTFHKYWGKKPANVVAAYIQRYAEAGATVLDPFSGSGIVLSEALIARRRAVATDVNPIANLITRVTAEAVDPAVLQRALDGVLAGLSDLRAILFADRCVRCGAAAERTATAFDGDRPVRVTVDCPACGTVHQDPCGSHGVTYASALPAPGEHPDEEIFAGWEMQKLSRRGLRRWSELFTPRNLVAVAHLRRSVEAVTDPRLRRALRVSFTAHLAQATRMIADYRGNAGGPSWKVNSYWLPTRWQELNPFRYFANRVHKTARGLADMRQMLGRTVSEGTDYAIHDLSAEAIATRVDRASVGYVFTDPPYGGEGIQYGELSMLWNLWASTPVSLDPEIAANPFQNKSHGQYADRLTRSFAAVHEVLVPGAWMSVTFANKDSVVWEAFLTACRRAGFVLEWVIPMAQSASNITNKVTHGAPKTDLIVTFRKPRATLSPAIRTWEAPGESPVEAPERFEFDRCAREEAWTLTLEGGSFRTSELYDRVLIRWMSAVPGSPGGRDGDPAPEEVCRRFTVYQVAQHLARTGEFVRVTEAAHTPGDEVWARSVTS